MVSRVSISSSSTPRKRPRCHLCGALRKGHPRNSCPVALDSVEPPALVGSQRELLDDPCFLHCSRCHRNFDAAKAEPCVIPHVFHGDKVFRGTDDDSEAWFYQAECCETVYVLENGRGSESYDMDLISPNFHFYGAHTIGIPANNPDVDVNLENIFDCWLDADGCCKRVPIDHDPVKPVWTEGVEQEYKKMNVAAFFKTYGLSQSVRPAKKPRVGGQDSI